jgi:selenide,water dikinase
MSGVEDTVDWDDRLSDQQRLLMCDAQTSGGLLISVPKAKLDQLLSELAVSSVETRAVVGEITAENSGRIRVTA